MDVPSDPVRGTFVEESALPVPRALSRRTQPPRQEQRSALSRRCSACAGSAAWHPLSRTSRRPTPILQSRRMNILTKWVTVHWGNVDELPTVIALRPDQIEHS